MANIGPKVPINVNGVGRIPDGLTSTVLSEVKNVARLSYTRQLRDFATFAQRNGLAFDLWTRSTTYLTRRLTQEVDVPCKDPQVHPMKKKWVTTAGELMAKLEADPDFIRQRAEREREHRARTDELRRAEEPLVEALRAAGYGVESVWDLVNTTAPYLGALPLLHDHLSRPYPAAIRDGIARALAVPESGVYWGSLVRHYKDETDERAKQGLAVALANVTNESLLDELIELARDPVHGSSRVLLLSALERSTHRRAHAVLMELGSDPELHKEVQIILRRAARRRKKERAPRQ